MLKFVPLLKTVLYMLIMCSFVYTQEDIPQGKITHPKARHFIIRHVKQAFLRFINKTQLLFQFLWFFTFCTLHKQRDIGLHNSVLGSLAVFVHALVLSPFSQFLPLVPALQFTISCHTGRFPEFNYFSEINAAAPKALFSRAKNRAVFQTWLFAEAKRQLSRHKTPKR